MTTTFDFQDGNGPVAAHQHPNGGGWVADTAEVAATAYVGPDARVYGNAKVDGLAVMAEKAKVLGDARVYGNAKVSGNAEVSGNAKVYEYAMVYGNAEVFGNARVFGDARVSGNAKVSGNARVYGNARVFESARINDTVIDQGEHRGPAEAESTPASIAAPELEFNAEHMRVLANNARPDFEAVKKQILEVASKGGLHTSVWLTPEVTTQLVTLGFRVDLFFLDVPTGVYWDQMPEGFKPVPA